VWWHDKTSIRRGMEKSKAFELQDCHKLVEDTIGEYLSSSTNISKVVRMELEKRASAMVPCRSSPSGDIIGSVGGRPYNEDTTSGAAPTCQDCVRQMELDCFAAYYIRSKDMLSGRTTGRLGCIRQTTAHAIGRTAELALRYSIITASTTGPSHYR
jgi:hypothetical protein